MTPIRNAVLRSHIVQEVVEAKNEKKYIFSHIILKGHMKLNSTTICFGNSPISKRVKVKISIIVNSKDLGTIVS